MKCLVILLSFFLGLRAFAQTPTLLECLGAEEKRFHLAKKTGPVYELNQRLIAEMVQIPNSQIRPEELKLVCSKGRFSESWKLLERTILKGKNLFLVSSSLSDMQKGMTEGMVEDYVENSREILLNFISAIQAEAPSATCLKEEIPKLDEFFIQIKYLQEDVDIKKIFEGYDQKIFESLKDYPQAFDKCRERLKKKLKPKSTPRPKKS